MGKGIERFYREINKSCEVSGFFQAVEAPTLDQRTEKLICALVAPLIHLRVVSEIRYLPTINLPLEG